MAAAEQSGVSQVASSGASLSPEEIDLPQHRKEALAKL